MSHYSAWSLLRNALSGHKNWDRAWRDPEPKKSYDVIIVGGGGHGRLNGIRADILTREDVMKEAPYLDFSDNARFPIYGAMLQPDAGTARHDAVVWGYARAANALGVDIIQNCEVLDYQWSGERITGLKTTRGDISAGKVGIAVAGHTSVLAQKAGLELPVESHVLQA